MSTGRLAPTAHSRPAAVGYAILTLGALMWSSNSVLAKGILDTGFDVTALAQLRVTVAAVLLLGIVAITKPRTLKLRRHEVLPFAVMGVFGIALTQFLFYLSVRELPVGVAMLLQFTAPLFIAVWFRVRHREVVKNMVWIGLALSIGSLALVGQIWDGFTLSIVGVAFALASAATMSVYYVKGDSLMRREDRRDPLSLAAWTFAFAAGFWAIAKPWWNFPVNELFVSAQPFGIDGPTVPMLFLVAWVVIIGTVATAPIIPVALRYVDASQASMIGMSEPIIAGALAWLALDEKLGPFQILGAIGVLSGIAIAERSRAGKPLMPRRRRLIPTLEPEIPIVVLGGGVTGLHAVHELRRNGITTPITIVGTEPPTEEIAAVTWEPAVFPTKVDVKGGTITLSDGRSLTTRGIISTNSQPWEMETPGPRGGMRAAYQPRDIDLIATDITPGANVLIIGGTVLGSDLAARARELGASVTVVTKDAELMTKVLGDVVGEIHSRLHEFHGVQIIRGRIVAEFTGDENGTVNGVVLDDGTAITADMVVQASGTIPVVVLDEFTSAENALGGLLAELSPADSDEPVATWASTQFGAHIEGWGAPGSDNDVQIISKHYDDATGQITRLIAAYWDSTGLTGVVGINATDGLAAYRRQLDARKKLSISST
jgi:drug/metabolite transporter (DMT)-like permease/thioredoxin reductase